MTTQDYFKEKDRLNEIIGYKKDDAFSRNIYEMWDDVYETYHRGQWRELLLAEIEEAQERRNLKTKTQLREEKIAEEQKELDREEESEFFGHY